MPKVSIISPVFNVEKYLNFCIDSLVNQTLYDIEIILVDDCSSDNSKFIISEYAKNDKRIKPIYLKSNCSTLVARKIGVEASVGDYIMFIDADDSLELNACEIAYKAAEKDKVDVLDFNVNIFSESWVLKSKHASLIDFLKPYDGIISDKNLLEVCFVDKSFSHSVWGKLYKSSICKKAYSEIVPFWHVMADDVYAVFLMLYYSHSYKGLQNDYLYNYYYGRGISGQNNIDFIRFEKYSSSYKILDNIKAFLERENNFINYKSIYYSLRQNIFSGVAVWWLDNVKNEDKEKCLNQFIKTWSPVDVFAGFFSLSENRKDKLVKNLSYFVSAKINRNVCTNIAIFTPNFNNGYPEYIKGQQKALNDLNKDVILISENLENEDNSNDFFKTFFIDTTEYKEKEFEFMKFRLENIVKICQNNKIDTVIINSPFNEYILWDILALRYSGISIIINTHEVFTAPLFENKDFFNLQPAFTFVDAIVSSSRVDASYYNRIHNNVYFIKDYYDIVQNELDRSDSEVPLLIWSGQLTMEKKWVEAIDIYENVLNQNQSTRLLIISQELDKGVFDATKNVEHHLEIKGFNDKTDIIKPKDFENYDISENSLFVSNHLYGNTDKSILSYKKYGIPYIGYETPYLESTEDSMGNVLVEPDDFYCLVNTILEIFNDKNKYQELSDAARKAYLDYNTYDYSMLWNKVIARENGKFDPLYADNTNLFDVLNLHYREWFYLNSLRIGDIKVQNDALSKKIKSLEKKIKTSNKKLKLVKNSKSFRLGMFITNIPRRIMKIIRRKK